MILVTAGIAATLTLCPDTPSTASYYGEAHRGATTASGEPFDPDALTAAHRTLPFGTEVVVVDGDGDAVTVEITDRGPALWTDRCIDLAAAAFAELEPLGAGVIDVTLREVRDG